MKKSFLKRFFTSAAAAAVMLFSGCTGNTGGLTGKSPEGIDSLYTAKCEVSVSGENSEICYGGTLVRLGGGMWQFDIESPETVKGLKIRLDEKGINASLGDLSFELEKDKIPSRAAFLQIFAALDNAAANKNDLALSETETNLVYSGNSGGEKYFLLCDKVNNRPCGINIGKISVTFTSFTVNGKVPEAAETVTSVSETGSETAPPAETTAATVSETITITAPVFTTAAEKKGT